MLIYSSQISRLLGTLSVGFVSKFVGAGAAFFMLLLISRTMSVEQYGEFAYGFSIAQFACIFLALGIHTLVLKEISAKIASGNLQEGLRIHSTSRICLLITSGIGFVVCLLIGLSLDQFFLWTWVGILSIGLTWAEFYSALIRASGSAALALFPRDIFWRISVIGVAGVALFYSFTFDAPKWLMILSILLAFFIALQILVFKSPLKLGDAQITDRVSFSQILKRSWGFWVIALIGTVDKQIPIVIIKELLGNEQAALFFTATNIAALLALPLLAAGPVVAPMISSAYERSNFDQIRFICAMTALVSTLGSIMAFIIIVFFGDLLFRMFGPGYTEAHDVLLILAFAQTVSAILGPTGYVLIMCGYDKLLMRYLIFAALISSTLVLALTLTYGLVGAAYGVSSLALISKFLSYAAVRSKLGIHVSVIGLLIGKREISDFGV